MPVQQLESSIVPIFKAPAQAHSKDRRPRCPSHRRLLHALSPSALALLHLRDRKRKRNGSGNATAMLNGASAITPYVGRSFDRRCGLGNNSLPDDGAISAWPIDCPWSDPIRDHSRAQAGIMGTSRENRERWATTKASKKLARGRLEKRPFRSFVATSLTHLKT
jgi:hypothetical protein